MARHAENHGKRNKIKNIFELAAAGGMIFLCSSVEIPWLKNSDHLQKSWSKKQ